MRRGGFTLAEVIVAITLLAVAVLAMAASGVMAAGLIRAAERESAATRLAATLLDSLVREPAITAGDASEGPVTASWSGSAGGAITLSVSYPDASGTGRQQWSAWSLSALRELPPVPERP